jgi:hypothetical protein
MLRTISTVRRYTAMAQNKMPIKAPVINVSAHGFWLFVGERELFVSFQQFPWFREAPIRAITNVRLPSPRHLYWPDLDVDLAVESIDHPEKYPLISQAQPDEAQRPTRRSKRGTKATRRSRATRG